MRRQDVTFSVSQPDPIRGGSDGPNARPVEASDASTGAFPHDSSTAQGPPGEAPPQPATDVPFPRWLMILAWSTGPAALYALLSLAHAAFVERILSVDVGFGRSLAFWIGSIYLALLAWGFLPRRPDAWYTRRGPLIGALAVGLVGLVVCGAFTGLWLAAHWVPGIAMPVIASIVVWLVAAVGVLWLAARDDRRLPPLTGR